MRRFAAAGVNVLLSRHWRPPARQGRPASLCLLNLCSKICETAFRVAKTFCPVLEIDLEALQPLLPVVQDVFEVIDRRDVRQIAFVVLQDVGHIIERHVLLGQVVLEIFETLDVLFHFFPLRIGHENDAVDAAQDELAGGVVNDLTGHGVELEFGDKALDDRPR